MAGARGGLAGGLGRLSRCFEIGASRGKMLWGGGGCRCPTPSPWIPIFRAAQGPPGIRFPHVRGTAVITEGEDV